MGMVYVQKAYNSNFAYLHFTVDNTSILPLTIDVMDLGDVVLLPEDGVEDVVQVDGEDVEEPAGPRRVHGVARVVRVRPRVGPDGEIFLFTASTIFCDGSPIGQSSISEEIQDFFVRIVLAAKKDKMFQGVREAIVVHRLIFITFTRKL